MTIADILAATDLVLAGHSVAGYGTGVVDDATALEFPTRHGDQTVIYGSHGT